MESFIAALLALVHTVAADYPPDVEILIGGERSLSPHVPDSSEWLQFAPSDLHGYSRSFKILLGGRFRAIHRTIDPAVDNQMFIRTAIEIATDCMNQIGFNRPVRLSRQLPPRP